jgi:uncharacterized protein (TIGR03437 family)
VVVRHISRSLLASFLTAVSALAYIQGRTGGGARLHRADFQNIQFVVNDQTIAGLTNADGARIISLDSSPVEALKAAFDTWNAAPNSQVHFAPLAPASLERPLLDGTQLVTFADTPRARAVVGGAIAVTLLFWNQDGELIDTDIVFSPTLDYSTTLEPGTFDIQATMTHELGHALGLDHSGIAGATMFALAARASDSLSTLASDDRAFVAATYPSFPAASGLGELTGRVTFGNGIAVRGAHVAAQDIAGNTVFGGITEADGTYKIQGVPAGIYVLYAEPLDGPTLQSQLGPAGAGINSSFHTAFHGGDNPLQVIFVAGTAREINFTVDAGSPALNIRGAGVSPIRSRSSAELVPGREYIVEVHGDALDDPSVTEASVSFLGTGCSLVPGSFEHAGTVKFTSGDEYPLLRFRITVAAGAPPGELSLRISSDAGSSVYSGGFSIVADVPRPQFTADAVVNAANFLPRGVSAGEIISIFGANLGPEVGVAGGLNPVTGRLETLVHDVSVTVNGIPLPLFFVRTNQINAMAPVEIAGLASVSLIVHYKHVSSAARIVPVLATNPGVFVFPETTQAIVLNANGTVNDPARPALRGSYISIFGTGQGGVDPPLATGELARGGADLSFFEGDTVVRIGGIEAVVLFAGMAPNFTGLFQINVFVPGGVTPGDAVLLELEVDRRAAQGGVTIAVR